MYVVPVVRWFVQICLVSSLCGSRRSIVAWRLGLQLACHHLGAPFREHYVRRLGSELMGTLIDIVFITALAYHISYTYIFLSWLP